MKEFKGREGGIDTRKVGMGSGLTAAPSVAQGSRRVGPSLFLRISHRSHRCSCWHHLAASPTLSRATMGPAAADLGGDGAFMLPYPRLTFFPRSYLADFVLSEGLTPPLSTNTLATGSVRKRRLLAFWTPMLVSGGCV